MKKYTIRLLFDVKGWAYYHRCAALKKYAPDDFDVSIGSDYGKALKQKPHDLVVQNAYSYAKALHNHKRKGKYNFLIVSSFNVGWGYQNQWLKDTIKYSDAVIVNNYEMWKKAGPLPHTYHISNGVDLSVFKPKIPIERRKPRVLWCGSRVHKGIKGYTHILVPLKQQLERKKISVDLKLTNSMSRNKLTHDQMAQWYNSGTIYVVASQFEGTPNPPIEAAGCGCVIVSTRVGNMPELIKHGENGFLCERNTQALYSHILKASADIKQMSDNSLKAIQDWHWKKRSKQFYNLFRKLIDERRK